MPSHFVDLVLWHNHISSRTSYMPNVTYSNCIYMHYTLICMIRQAGGFIFQGFSKVTLLS